MKMDLKHFKKLHSNEASTTFVHKHGHKIVVAHKGLDKGTIASLQDLPKFESGGSVGLHADYSQDQKRTVAQEAFTGKSSEMGGKERKQLERSVSERLGNRAVDLRLPTGMAEGGTAGQEFDLDLSGSKLPQAKTPLYQDPSITSQAPYSDQFGYESPQANSEQPPEVLQNVQIPRPQQQANPLADATSEQLGSAQQSVANMEAGINQQAQAETQLGQREVQVAREQQKQSADLQQHFQSKSDEIDNERMSVYNDLKNGHIDPNHFVNSMSGFQKGMTAIGLILSGMGGGMTGQASQASEFLDKQINNDIDAQKAEMGKKENLLSHLNQQMGNLKDATIMAKAIQSDMYAAKMLDVAAQSKDPMAMARAKQAVAEMHFSRDKEMLQMKISQTLLQGSANGQISPETLVQRSPLVPEHQRPEMAKQLGKLRSLEGLRSNMNESFDQISSKVLNGTFSPNDTESAKQAFTGKLVQLSEGRYNYEAAQNLTNAMFPARTDSASTVASKKVRLDSLIDSMAAEPRSILAGVGINVPKAASSKFHKR